jgi:hypothetical protein
MTAFLDDDEVRTLTGRTQKSKQIEQLKRMGVPFFVNAAGKPIVAKSAVDGSHRVEVISSSDIWRPSVLGA